MGSFLRADLPSDDEEDDDYDPTKDTTAEKADIIKGPGSKGGTRGGVKRKRGASVAGAGGEDEDDVDDSGDEDEDELSPRTRAKRAKAAELFAKLNQAVAAKAAAAASGRPGAVVGGNGVAGSLGSLPLRGALPPAAARAVPKPAISLSDLKSINLISLCKQEQPPKKVDADKFWMQQLLSRRGAKPAPGSSAAATGTAMAPPAIKPVDAGAADKPGTALLAAQALEAAKTATSVAAIAQAGKVVVTESRTFAGQEIQVKKAVDAGSRQAQQAQEAAQPKSGLDAVLSGLAAAKKVTILDKSRQDWSGLKESNAALEDELEAHKKGSDQYLDKQSFLQRAELREYEQERDRRLASDMRTRGRL